MSDFSFDVNVLSKNPKVLSVNKFTLTLCTDFRIELYNLWKNASTDEMRSLLNENDLVPELIGPTYIRYLINTFKSGGYPVYKLVEYPPGGNPNSNNPLIVSGKYEVYTKGNSGIKITSYFLKELFAEYPATSIEDGFISAGLDPVDAGATRLRELKADFDRQIKTDKLDSQAANERYETRSKSSLYDEDNDHYLRREFHPYIAEVTDEEVILSDAFYNEIHCLASTSIEEILAAYELPKRWFTERNILIIRAKQANWNPISIANTEIAWTEQLFRINKNRCRLLEKALNDRYKIYREMFPQMDVVCKKILCRYIAEIPMDPIHIYTREVILNKVGIPKSSFYKILNDENYGKNAAIRNQRDEEDIRQIMMVLDYKGFAKGIRQVYMLMTTVTGHQFSMYKIRRLINKYGISTSIRQSTRQGKNMKELVKRNRKSNLLLRMFRLHRPNEIRLTDVTYLDYGDGLRAYGSASIDPATGRVICFIVSEKNDLQLALDTLKAMDKYPAKQGAILHSDQGLLYMHDEFQSAVLARNLNQSMSRRGNCWDNAPQEAFFGHFKDESGYEKCKNLEELGDKVEAYVIYYNEERKIWERGRMTPVEYEKWLNDMSDSEFQDYIKAEEKKYLKTKEESVKKAIRRNKEYRENTIAALKEITDETDK